MCKYVLNSVVKITLMFAQYFEYYAIILRGPFFRGHTVQSNHNHQTYIYSKGKERKSIYIAPFRT